jgi:hypothetical protein
MTRHLSTLGLAALLVTGCIHDQAPWREVGGAYDSGNWFGPRISMPLPVDWMMLNHVEDGLLATRDGFNLQTIAIVRVDPGDPLPHTKKKVVKGMRPNELAEVLLDDLRGGSGVNGFTVVDTRPVTIGGSPGFRAAVAFKDEWGMRVRAVVCGTIVGSRAFRISYLAPARHYFDKDLATFDAALAGIQIR